MEEPKVLVLKPAVELAARSAKPYPNDSAEYRQARTALLVEEIELRRQIERVAKQRRQLPLGGEARKYEFLDEQGKSVNLNQMFGRHDTLVTYFWDVWTRPRTALPDVHVAARVVGYSRR